MEKRNTNKRHAIKGRQGVFYRWARVRGKNEYEKAYYIRYKLHGTNKEDFVGRSKTDEMTPAQASLIRSDVIRGDRSELPKPRRRKKALALTLEQVSRENGLAPEHMPPDYWTFDMLFRYYVRSKPDLKGHSFQSYYTKRLRPLIGALLPKDITPLKIDAIRATIKKERTLPAGDCHWRDYYLEKGDKKAARKYERKIAEHKRLKKGKPLSPSTVELHIEAIRRLSRWGAKNKLCPGPEDTIQLKHVDSEKTEYLTSEQIRRVFKACEEDPHQDAADIMRLALLTGIRHGSLIRLAWEHINWEAHIISCETLTPHKDRHSKSDRKLKVPMSAEAEAILRARLEVANLEHSGYVFPNKKGSHRYPPYGPLARIRDAAGLPKDFRPVHGMRHSLATALASSGKVELFDIQKILGHRNPKTTMRYAHLRDKAIRKAASRMGGIVRDALEGSPEETPTEAPEETAEKRSA